MQIPDVRSHRTFDRQVLTVFLLVLTRFCFITFGGFVALGCWQQPSSFSFSHILVVFRGSRPRRRVSGQTARPGRNDIADTGCDPLVDSSATGEAARLDRDDNHQGELAGTW